MNYYKVLGVHHDISDREIIDRYRDLAMVHHPDRGGDMDEFTQLNEAYHTLKDYRKRELYDNILRIRNACPTCLGSELVKRRVGFTKSKIVRCPDCRSAV